MLYYAVQVTSRGEDEYTRLLRSRSPEIRVLVPKRTVILRKGGGKKRTAAPIFPGYVFLGMKGDLDAGTRWTIRRIPGFCRFLPSNQDSAPLSGRDLDILTHFISFGERADTSRVTFDADDRIVVLEGPLKGLEGRIVKVNRRKGRAKVLLDMCRNAFLIDLAFTVVDIAGKGRTEPNGEAKES